MLVHGTLCNGNDRLPQGTIHVFTRPGYTVQYWVLTVSVTDFLKIRVMRIAFYV